MTVVALPQYRRRWIGFPYEHLTADGPYGVLLLERL